TIEGTARNDWSSTLPKGQNSYFYPSVNASFVLTDAMPSLRNNYLSFLQFRSRPQFTLANAIANPTLKPEITNSNEFGAEMGLLNGRINVDATVYDKITKNQIFNVSVSPTTGFTSKNINAGAITNKGVEVGITAIPVQLRNGFEWSSTFNYSHNGSKVKELYVAPTGDTVKTIVLGSAWYVNTEARLGEPYGALFGYSFQRDSATGKLMTSGGTTVLGDRRVLGNIQPK